MYGLEDQSKKKKPVELVFELEKSLEDKKERTALKKKVEDRLHEFKDLLHAGCDKSHFDKIGRILYGYSSLMRVFSRFEKKK